MVLSAGWCAPLVNFSLASGCDRGRLAIVLTIDLRRKAAIRVPDTASSILSLSLVLTIPQPHSRAASVLFDESDAGALKSAS